MATIVVAMQKGGTGKTTISINLAVMRAMAGHDVLLVDADPQRSSSGWASLRFDNGISPGVTCVEKRGKLGADLVRLGQKFETVIVDVGGFDTVEMRQSIAVASQLIIPLSPSLFDTWSLNSMLQMVRDIEEKTGERPPIAALVNSAAKSTSELEELHEALADYRDELPIYETVIYDRVAFRRAARTGQGVAEFEAKGEAAAEIKKLYFEVFHEEFKPAITQQAA